MQIGELMAPHDKVLIVEPWSDWKRNEHSEVVGIIDYFGVLYLRLQNDFEHDWSVLPARCVQRVD